VQPLATICKIFPSARSLPYRTVAFFSSALLVALCLFAGFLSLARCLSYLSLQLLTQPIKPPGWSGLGSLGLQRCTRVGVEQQERWWGA